jgi:hypothetical protein
LKALGWVKRFLGNFWYYYVGRKRLGCGSLPIEVAVVLAYDHTTRFSRHHYAPLQRPAWGGKVSDFDD